MPSQSQLSTLAFERVVAVPAAEAYRAFVHPTALRDWLCQFAHLDVRQGGYVFLRWEDGYTISGNFLKVDVNKRIEFNWASPADAGPSTVRVDFRPRREGTLVALSHIGLGTTSRWKDTRQALLTNWPAALENLQSHLEHGIDLRRARRPRLGIAYGEFTPALAKQLAVPVKRGLYIENVLENTGAHTAGLQKGDVLIKFNGKQIYDASALGNAITGLQAGDTPEAELYRGPQKVRAAITLSAFPMLDLPAQGTDLAARVKPLHAKINAEWAQALTGLTEAQANTRPAPNEWSINELLAHFILTERDLQSWIADMLNDRVVGDDLEMRPNVQPRLTALVNRLGTPQKLLTELKHAETETLGVLEALPESFTRYRKHLFRRVTEWTLQVTPGHWHEEHLEQVRNTLRAVRPQ